MKQADEEIRHYTGQFGEFDYYLSEAGPVIDEDKARAYDIGSGFTGELWDYDPADTVANAHKDPTEYDFLVKEWDFKDGMIPKGYHPWDVNINDVTIDF